MLFLLHQVGPYHHARLQHFSRSVDLFVAEINPASQEYDWHTTFEKADYRLIKFNADNGQGQYGKLIAALIQVQPDVIITTGWFNWQYHAAIVWAKQKGIPVMGISDSTYLDTRRYWLLEKFKSLLISFFDALLVAGSRSKQYAIQLGMPAEAIYQPWDVVDNDHFAKTEKINNNIEETIRKLKEES